MNVHSENISDICEFSNFTLKYFHDIKYFNLINNIITITLILFKENISISFLILL